LGPAWHQEDDAKGAMNVVMTGGPDDPEYMARHVRSKAGRKALADRFKDPADEV
jgi:type I restriction enzyme R subunit